MNPIVKVIQISDLHCGPRSHGIDAHARHLLRSALPSIIPPPIRMQITKRIAGHDPTAWKELRISIRNESARDPWPLTWLVTTGDLSTWGDDRSIKQALALVHLLAQDAKAQHTAVLYGNHDAWVGQPGSLGGFPLFTHQNDLDIHRSGLHVSAFQEPCPHVVPVAQLPNGKKLMMASVNTIEHERVRNAVARGAVRPERYWESAPGQDQLQELGKLAANPDAVLIALTHHPIHSQSAWKHLAPLSPLVLSNATDAANALTASYRTRPCVVMSGHTHETFPNFGDSTGAHPQPPHVPLGADHVQFVAGTASQAEFGPMDKRKPHVWQQIQIYANSTHLRLERIVYARWNGVGSFVPVTTDPNDPLAIADVFELKL